MHQDDPMKEVGLFPIRKDKMLVAVNSRNIDAVTIINWSKKFGSRLNAYHDGMADVIEISDVIFHEFLEIQMDYFWGTKQSKIKLLYKHSDNRHYNQLPRPRIDIYLYSE